MLARGLILTLMALFCATCKSPTAPVPSDPKNISVPRAVAEEDYVQLDNGLKYYDFKEGTGDPAKNQDILSVHYHGWLTDSTLFDTSYLKEQPHVFRLGAGNVIAGWDQGLVGMRQGGERQLVIPPELAYGESGRGSIPANATLIFEVILTSID